jgi:hypothetical protein
VRAALLAGTLMLLARPANAEPEVEPRDPNLVVPTLHALGLMTAMRVSEALIWPEPFAHTDLSEMGRSYQYAFTHWPKFDPNRPAFEWDGDPWYVNGIGHALFGSELYLRARTCNNGVLPALIFAAAASSVWEYGFEANEVQPSALDLVYTPAAGLVFGEARFVGWRAARRISDPGWRAVWTTLLDPFGELERGLGTRC